MKSILCSDIYVRKVFEKLTNFNLFGDAIRNADGEFLGAIILTLTHFSTVMKIEE